MKLLILLTFVFITQLVQSQPLFSKADSLLYELRVATCTWELNEFANIHNLKNVNDRSNFFNLWLFKNKIGRASIDKEILHVYINADSANSLFDIKIPADISSYSDHLANTALIENLGLKIYQSILHDDWKGAGLYLLIRIGDYDLRAMTTMGGMDWGLFIETLELVNRYFAVKVKQPKSKGEKFLTKVAIAGIAIIATILGIDTYKNLKDF